jgi:iron complex outermembrane receptor protein
VLLSRGAALLIFAATVSVPRVVSTQTVTPRAAGEGATIRGSVHDPTGAPLQAVRVGLTGPVNHVTHTVADGSFTFPTLPAGDYEIVTSLTGFASATRAARVRPGDSQFVALTMWVQILEQVRVTAAKTGERDAQDTAMAVSVLPGPELERSRVETIEDAARLAPSVTFSQNTGFAQLTIRGIGTNAVFTGSDPSSAVYIDGVYLARPAMALTDLLEVERLEVLRGPQGTLYGRNAVGGAVNVITSDPGNEVSAAARLVAGNFDTWRSQARLSGPLVQGRVLGSMAIQRGVSRGFVRDVHQPDQYLGADDVWAARGRPASCSTRPTR